MYVLKMPATACGSRSLGSDRVKSRSAPASNSFRNRARWLLRPLIRKMPSSFGPHCSTARQSGARRGALTIFNAADDNGREAKPSSALVRPVPSSRGIRFYHSV